MKYISPTRVSIYDFLYEDTLPLTVLLADIAHLSAPQAKIALNSSLQAIVSALLSYQSRYNGETVIKRLFSHSGIKELRQYNSMNFATIESAVYHRQGVADTLFPNSRSISIAAERIVSQIQVDPSDISNVHKLLTTVCVICLRELAILADYAHLDGEDLDNWFKLQPQFLATARFEPPNSDLDASPSSNTHDDPVSRPPIAAFDPYWYELTKFKPPTLPHWDKNEDGVPHYAKVIGRSAANASQSLHDDLLAFAPMPSITLPHQRWLLQLAKIGDIYLSRHRLKITSEPKVPPSRPLVNLGILGNSDTPPTTSIETPIEYDDSTPLWRNPVILLIILVIGVLGALAFLKYQSQQAQLAKTGKNSLEMEKATKTNRDH